MADAPLMVLHRCCLARIWKRRPHHPNVRSPRHRDSNLFEQFLLGSSLISGVRDLRLQASRDGLKISFGCSILYRRQLLQGARLNAIDPLSQDERALISIRRPEPIRGSLPFAMRQTIFLQRHIMQLLIVYVSLVVAADLVAIEIGLYLDRVFPSLSLPIALGLFFGVLGLMWSLSVYVTERWLTSNSTQAPPPSRLR